MRSLSPFIIHPSDFRLPFAAEEVLGPAGDISKLDGADAVDEFADAVVVLRFAHDLQGGFALKECAIALGSVEVGAAVVFVERALEAGVVAFRAFSCGFSFAHR